MVRLTETYSEKKIWFRYIFRVMSHLSLIVEVISAPAIKYRFCLILMVIWQLVRNKGSGKFVTWFYNTPDSIFTQA